MRSNRQAPNSINQHNNESISIMRAILLACVMSTLTIPAFAQQPPKPPEPQTTTIYAPPGGVAMAVVYPTRSNDETIVVAFTDNPETATAHRLTASALLVAFSSPGTCANVTISTTTNDVRHRFCAEEGKAPGTADGVGVIREVAACLMRGENRERCEERAPAEYRQSAEGTARSIDPEDAESRAE